MPDVHVLSGKQTGPIGVEQDQFAVLFDVEGEVLMVVVVAGTVIGGLLVRLDTMAQRRQRLDGRETGERQCQQQVDGCVENYAGD